ncbi:ABC transporter substrate-binding protein [Clostridium intestinale]|uniref:NitT/TauT family transport system substrate-binding protein n=1 Tax=Clostridium intestinale DSM 6191 TaxID=1121320 RepID=A0A1M5V159_9CLOT|nr:ABC transporter substrate-binding protein [Clostridium intestinale]SHH68916.1 NitT/TauT family transport system substrate-binding protein [Clostridium intestinale DSM 6191]
MKKLKAFLSIVLTFVLILTVGGCTKKPSEGTKDVTKVRLNEVVRSVFYAPMYAAINNGYFEEEGIEIDLSTGQGADSTCTKTQEKTTIINSCFLCVYIILNLLFE